MPNLTDLPAELRNKIYDELIPTGLEYSLHPGDRQWIPEICRVCRLLRQESLPIWRSSNIFTIRSGTIVSCKPECELAPGVMAHLESGFKHIQKLEYADFWTVPAAFGLPRTIKTDVRSIAILLRHRWW